MRGLIREGIFYLASLYLLDKVFPFITITSTAALVTAAAGFFLLNTIGKPILKVLWLPINIITLGLFSWVIHIVVVLLVLLLVPGFQLSTFATPALQVGKLLIPAISLKMIPTYIVFSLLLAIGVNLSRWIMQDDE